MRSMNVNGMAGGMYDASMSSMAGGGMYDASLYDPAFDFNAMTAAASGYDHSAPTFYGQGAQQMQSTYGNAGKGTGSYCGVGMGGGGLAMGGMGGMSLGGMSAMGTMAAQFESVQLDTTSWAAAGGAAYNSSGLMGVGAGTSGMNMMSGSSGSSATSTGKGSKQATAAYLGIGNNNNTSLTAGSSNSSAGGAAVGSSSMSMHLNGTFGSAGSAAGGKRKSWPEHSVVQGQ